MKLVEFYVPIIINKDGEAEELNDCETYLEAAQVILNHVEEMQDDTGNYHYMDYFYGDEYTRIEKRYKVNR